jgi:2-desacetyl-2-hydroxyethyl bacteriochlorophyllide A dehydrogenase
MTTTAMVLVAPGRLELREVAVPSLEEGAVLLRVLLTEVCGTDVHLLHGRLPEAPYPLIPGHFAVGKVEALRGSPTYTDGCPVRVGDLATFLDVYGTCGRCWYCEVAHATTRCPNRKVYGITFGAELAPLGAWSEVIYLKPGTRLLRLDGISPARYIGGGCGLATALHAVDRARVRLGDSVVVQGSGPVGLNAALLASLSGATMVVLVGAPAMRLEAGRKMGVDATINVETTTSDERVSMVKELTDGRGADVVIEATGVPAAIPEGMAMARDAGTYVVAGQYTDAGDVAFNPHVLLNKKHLDVRATWGIDLGHLHRALRIVRRHGDTYRWEELISRTYPLSEARAALEDVAAGRLVKAAIQPNPAAYPPP